MTLAKVVYDGHGKNLDAYRLSFQLSAYGDRLKNTTPYNYYLKDVPLTGDIRDTLDQPVYFENGGNSSKVVAVDVPARLVMTESGSVYYLGKQFSEGNPPSAKLLQPFRSADDYVDDAVLAREYVDSRVEDARKFTKSLVWGNQDIRWPHCIYADVYGYRVIHDLSGRVLNTTEPRWGEMVKIEGLEVEEVERFETFDCFVAYMLAKFW